MFCFHTTLPVWLTQQSSVIFDLYLKKTGSERSRDYRDVIVFERFHFENVFCPQKRKAGVFIYLGFEERFRKVSVFVTD